MEDSHNASLQHFCTTGGTNGSSSRGGSNDDHNNDDESRIGMEHLLSPWTVEIDAGYGTVTQGAGTGTGTDTDTGIAKHGETIPTGRNAQNMKQEEDQTSEHKVSGA